MEEKEINNKVNGLLIIYVFCFVFALFWDYLKLGEFIGLDKNSPDLTKLPDVAIVLIFLLIVMIIGWIWIKRTGIAAIRSRVYFTKIDLWDGLVLAIIAFITLWRLPFPDASFDTIHYHLFLQQSPFENNISNNFFAAGIQTYTFALGDRLFYFFRFVAGYRAGVLLNSLVLILIYLQLKDILLSHSSRYKIQPRYVQALMGFSILSTEFILANIGIYMIDLLPLPFLIEIFKITIGNRKDEAFTLVYGFALMGLAIAIKFYSIIFCFPLAVILFARHIRSLNLKLVGYLLVGLTLPVLPYIIFNFVQTGNPIYPYFNNIFKSPYYSPVYTKDPRFGPANLLELISWPILVLFMPKRAVELPFYSGRLGLGFLLLIFYLIREARSKNKIRFYLTLLVTIFFFLWIITTGYIRYALFLEIISGIVIVLTLLTLITSRNKWMTFLGASLLVLYLAQIGYGYYLTLTNKTDWSERATIATAPQLYFKNLRWVGSDRSPRNLSHIQQVDRIIKTVDIWYVLPGDLNAGTLALLNSKAPIINLYVWDYTQANLDTYRKLAAGINFKTEKVFLLSCRTDRQISKELQEVGLQMADSTEIVSTILDSRRNCKLVRVMSE